jgi:hypothetical protein
MNIVVPSDANANERTVSLADGSHVESRAPVDGSRPARKLDGRERTADVDQVRCDLDHMNRRIELVLEPGDERAVRRRDHGEVLHHHAVDRVERAADVEHRPVRRDRQRTHRAGLAVLGDLRSPTGDPVAGGGVVAAEALDLDLGQPVGRDQLGELPAHVERVAALSEREHLAVRHPRRVGGRAERKRRRCGSRDRSHRGQDE